jgi:acetylglutamate kinase
MHGTTDLTFLKLGGELLEPGADLDAMVAGIATLAGRGPLAIVHGGGREIDAETARRGVPKQAIDGLRITDAATLEAVVAVLAGTVNTRLVSGLVSRGVRAVGLTGADALVGLSTIAPPHRTADGRSVDLGLVGQPESERTPTLMADLVRLGYVPALACLGVTEGGQILNVNADTMAAALAAGLGARRLIIAGGTAGVFDKQGQTIPLLDLEGIDALIGDGTASAGMIAKLRACRAALDAGVREVAIVHGRDPKGLLDAAGTRITMEKAHVQRNG